MYLCEDVGVTASLQQGEDTSLLTTVCSLVQSCLAILQHRGCIKQEAENGSLKLLFIIR